MVQQSLPQVVYNADPSWLQTLVAVKTSLIDITTRCIGLSVRVQTIDGRTYDGVLMGADGCHVYLHVGRTEQSGYAYPAYPAFPGYAGYPAGYSPGFAGNRAFFAPVLSSAILPLVLYELLVITLLYT
ncbi:acetyl-CoA acetyltransferase [Paenibacillus darwinianus]|uniref:Acetyl-CoA acetyltransferase n=1 Tax=Paenibacillus darwinianus TaxID=1380763 RepID=A0A9W5RYT0_9BACL|nr:hypothetical protein [Paenibacillus darwinianus]EXX84600.1 acetyl-CoA acetyltransferase [Paenibacillus darwinianus]EXX86848.1 acetyl-CoA acetyltransferase [Paenibacillus darwinianus]EXX88019.1 acetyl-CoA acetyltransferase [Paenibacillus darwinianus]